MNATPLTPGPSPARERGELRPLARPPEALSAALAHELRRAARELALEGDVALSGPAREALRWRKADLECALSPIGEDALDRILVSLSTMIAQATPGIDGKLALRLARHDLKPLPEFALHAAAEDFRRGKSGEGFRPTVAELSRLTRLKTQRFAEEAAQIARVLAAPERKRIDPVEKARVAAGIAELRVSLERASAEAELDRRDPHPRPLSRAGEGRTLDEILAEHARGAGPALSAEALRGTRRAAADARAAEIHGGAT